MLVDRIERAGLIAFRSLPAALALAFTSAGILVSLGVTLSSLSRDAQLPLLLIMIWFHAVFVVALTWWQVHPGGPLRDAVKSPGLAAGLLLAIPILLVGLLDAYGASYVCADGRLVWRASVPDWPWLWIGWFLLAVGAVPARAIGLVIGQQPPLIPIWQRAILAIPFAPLLWLTGVVFEWRQVNCTPPFDQPGWGLLEGGLVLWPLLGLFWFTASFSLAIVSAVSVDQPAAA